MPPIVRVIPLLRSLFLLGVLLAPPLFSDQPRRPLMEIDRAGLQLQEPVGVLALDAAAIATLLGNPDLQAFDLEKRAVEVRRLQASLRPNPEVDFALENVPGGTVGNNAPIQATLSYGLPFELGGKRAARLRLAAAEAELAARDYEVKRIDVLTALRRAFYSVLGAQRPGDVGRGPVRVVVVAAEPDARREIEPGAEPLPQVSVDARAPHVGAAAVAAAAAAAAWQAPASRSAPVGPTSSGSCCRSSISACSIPGAPSLEPARVTCRRP